MFNILVLYGTARKFTKFQNTRISLLFRSFVLFDLFLKQIHSTRLQIVNTVLEVLAARHLYFSKALAARHLYFLKYTLLARRILQLLELAKINKILACS